MFWWIAATVCAFFVKGLCGFANTLVFTSILSFGNSNIHISPVDLMLGYLTNLIMAWRERRSIRWRVCIPLILLILAGCIPGALFLKNADAGIIKTLFGAVIILIGLQMLIGEFRTRKPKQSRLAMGIIGILSGVLCGLYGIGALLAAYLNRISDDSSAFKANICVVFSVENTFRVILYSLWGIITWDAIRQTAILIPVMLISLWLGMFSSRFLNEKRTRRIIILMLIASGIALIINNL